MEVKYLLSNGKGTTSKEEYLVDLFKLYLLIHPGDIQGSSIGFNRFFGDIHKNKLPDEVKFRIEQLVDSLSKYVGGTTIKLTSLEMLSPSRVRIVISVNELTEEISLNIYE